MQPGCNMSHWAEVQLSYVLKAVVLQAAKLNGLVVGGPQAM
jgi:hypothetical protein